MKYLPEDFDGTLLIYEALGVKGDSGSLSLRAIGEGESIETIYPMRNEITGKMEMGRAKTNAKNFITTSSDIDINPDLYRRVLKHTMNHSTQLTKRVMAKKLRDAIYPDSLKNALGLQQELPFKEQDFQNALRLLNWKLEAVVFTPPELLRILDLAVKREQEVALRTHIEKIINFTKAIALLNQRHRLHVKVSALEFVVADPSDFLKALEILRTSIIETVSRIEKRQEEALKLFTNSDVSLNKNDVASKLKVSTKTATRMLKTLAQAGYLKEEAQGKTHQYQLLQKEPNHLDLLENIRSFSLFHQNSLRNWLNTIETTGHAKGVPCAFSKT
jgi:predicted transcriptional regulator